MLKKLSLDGSAIILRVWNVSNEGKEMRWTEDKITPHWHRSDPIGNRSKQWKRGPWALKGGKLLR